MTTQDENAQGVPLSFEGALKELEAIVERLERGEVSLDDAVAAYERGSELKSQCQARLDEARLKVDKIRAAKASPEIEGTAAFDAE
ncbi:MAG: exodeoxyribonuclease VII small subunit [Candidatus Puniceispirillales bacterium WSBS_2018_MAG_OTU23]